MTALHRLWPALAVLGGLIAGACTTPEIRLGGETVYDLDHRERHPITVETGTATLTLPGAGGVARLSAIEARRLQSFVAAYRDEGHGVLTITVPGAAASKTRALSRAKQIADLAKGQGLLPDQVLMRVDTEDERADGPVEVSFDRFVMVLPECRDWSKESSNDPTNTVHSNFGCATQRSHGMMIANPGDLVAPRAVGMRDAPRSNMVIQRYRAGEATFAVRAEEERAEIAEVE